MSEPWAMQINLRSASAAGLLRTTPGIDAKVTETALWLRGTDLTDTLDILLRHIPGERFHVTGAGTLIPIEAKLPVQLLPAGAWQPLRTILSVTLPPSALPAQPSAKIQCVLIPSTTEAPANFMFAARSNWSRWAHTTPSVRLRVLRFALSHDTAAIHGYPLPNVAGHRHVERNGVVVPCGYTISPTMEEATIAQACSLAAGDLAVFGLDGQCDFLSAEMFVAGSRSAVRLSDRGASDSAAAEASF